MNNDLLIILLSESQPWEEVMASDFSLCSIITHLQRERCFLQNSYLYPTTDPASGVHGRHIIRSWDCINRDV